MNDNVKKNDGGLKLTNRVVVALWLSFFYFFSIWLVLGTLCSRQFQDRIRQIQDAEGGKYSIASLIEVLHRIDRIDRELTSNEIVSNSALRKKVELESQVREYEARLAELGQQKNDLFDALSRSVTDLDVQYVINNESSLEDIITEKFPNDSRSSDLFRKLINVHKEFNKSDVQLQSLLLNLDEAKKEYLEAAREKKELEDRRISLYSKNNTIKGHINDMLYMRRMKFNYLATMPDQLLTLILCLAMGALGSVIFVTRTFLESKGQKDFTWYFFRPFLGMVTALAVFVLAKAGQIVISDNATLRGAISNSLNPFFVSFLAIISGILSDQAYERIQSSGIAFFKTKPETKQRWAVGLKTEMANQDRSVRDLAEVTKLPERRVSKWVKETEPVPEYEQKIISAWLRRAGRELFTDLPPEKTSKTEEEEETY